MSVGSRWIRTRRKGIRMADGTARQQDFARRRYGIEQCGDEQNQQEDLEDEDGPGFVSGGVAVGEEEEEGQQIEQQEHSEEDEIRIGMARAASRADPFVKASTGPVQRGR